MDKKQLIDKLLSIVHFLPEEIEVIKDSFNNHQYKKGEHILLAGTVARQIHFVVNGLVRVYHLSKGKEVTTYLACDDGFISSYSSFTNQSKSYESIQCLENTQTFSINFAAMQSLYHDIPKWERIGRVLAEKNYLCMADRVLTLQMIPGKEKYLNFLQTSEPKIVQRTPLIHVASFLGITPESLSRIRKSIS